MSSQVKPGPARSSQVQPDPARSSQVQQGPARPSQVNPEMNEADQSNAKGIVEKIRPDQTRLDQTRPD